MTYKICFKLISCYNTIELPQPMNKITSIKISKLQYKITSPNIYCLKISIPSFNTHSFFDGKKSTSYFFMIFNDGNSDNLINYHNYYDIPDFLTNNPRGINNITINITDDEDHLLSEINQDNPLMIELEFS